MIFIRLLLLSSFVLWFPSAWKRWTHAFRLEKCALKWPVSPDWETPDPDHTICKILEQPFTYLSKGAQSYVFLSADQKYVLKLFRFDNCRIPLGQQFARYLRNRLHLREKYVLPFREKVPKTLMSCKLAYDLAPHLTGVVWVHLNPRRRNLPMISVRDRLGRLHCIDPAFYRFALQKKAQTLLSVLRKEPNLAPWIHSYQSLLSELSRLGLANLDPNMGKNFGFIDGKAVEIDFGNFTLDFSLAAKDPEHFSKRLLRWLERHRPDDVESVSLGILP